MRNLLEYPVTSGEAVSAIQIALEQYTREIKDRGIGDMDGIALLMAEKFIESNRERFDTFAKASLEVVVESSK
jgi:hypothetical protein